MSLIIDIATVAYWIIIAFGCLLILSLLATTIYCAFFHHHEDTEPVEDRDVRERETRYLQQRDELRSVLRDIVSSADQAPQRGNTFIHVHRSVYDRAREVLEQANAE